MEIEKQFNLIAGKYDSNRKKFIPCFDDFYAGTTEFLAFNMRKPERILDLGAGTGLLTYEWMRHFPKTEYVLVDVAEEMLKVAQKRFHGLENVTYRVSDYTKNLPQDSFDLIVSALSVHHLEQEEKCELFARIYDLLPVGGMFLNYDQFCAGQPTLNQWFDAYWENQLTQSGLSPEELASWRERKRLDRECSVEQETDMLRRSRFQRVKCVYSCGKFSVIVAVK